MANGQDTLAALADTLLDAVLGDFVSALVKSLLFKEPQSKLIDGYVLPTHLLKKLEKRLRTMLKESNYSKEALSDGVRAAHHILRRAPLPSADLVISTNMDAHDVARRWISKYRSSLVGDPKDVCMIVVEEAVRGVFDDVEYRSRIMSQVVIGAANASAKKSRSMSGIDLIVASAYMQARIDAYYARPIFKSASWPVHDLFRHLEQDWVADIRAAVGEIHDEMQRRHINGPLLTSNPLIATADATLAILREVSFTQNLEELVTQIYKSARGTRLPDVVKAYTFLRAQIVSPNYRACLPLRGSWGTGKTNLMYALAREALSRGHIVLMLSGQVASLTEDLLASAQETLGRSFSSIAELVEKLHQARIVAIVLLDDIDEHSTRRPAILQELRHLLSLSTERRALRWVISADPSGGDYLFDAEDPDFWSRYGVGDSAAGTASFSVPLEWFDLDQYVVVQSLGLRMIENHGSPDTLRFLKHATAGDRQDVSRFLCRPRVASILLTGFPPDESAGVSESTFVDLYWKRVFQSREHLGERERLESLVYAFADAFVEGADGTASWPQVRVGVFVSPTTDDIQTASRLRNALRSAGVIVAHLDDRDLELVAGEIMWGQTIASRLLGTTHSSPAELHDVLRDWARATSDAMRILRYFVFRSLFERLVAQPDYTKPVVEIWKALLTAGAPNDSLWIAAATAPASTQSLLSTHVWSRRSELVAASDTFLLLRWMERSSVSAWDPLMTIEVIASRLRAIPMLGLSTSTQRVIFRALNSRSITNDKDLRRALRALDQFHNSRLSLSLAETFVAATSRRIGAEDTLRSIIGYLHEDALRTKDLVSDPANDTFVSVLLRRGIDEVLRTGFQRGARSLLSKRWAPDEAHEHPANHPDSVLLTNTQKVMRIAIGHFYFTSSREVISLLNALANGSSKDLHDAIFIARHTAVTHRKRYVRLDLELRPILETIAARQRDVRPDVWNQWVAKMLHVNGIAQVPQGASKPGISGKRPSHPQRRRRRPGRRRRR